MEFYVDYYNCVNQVNKRYTKVERRKERDTKITYLFFIFTNIEPWTMLGSTLCYLTTKTERKYKDWTQKSSRNSESCGCEKKAKKCCKFLEASISVADIWVALLYFSITPTKSRQHLSQGSTPPRAEWWTLILLCHGHQAAHCRREASVDLFELPSLGKLQQQQLK